MSLSGTIQADTRSALITKARELALKYYGSSCVRVVLTDERPTVGGFAPIFTAEFSAAVHHGIDYRSYGPNRCLDCKAESWPHSPLPGDRSKS